MKNGAGEMGKEETRKMSVPVSSSEVAGENNWKI